MATPLLLLLGCGWAAAEPGRALLAGAGPSTPGQVTSSSCGTVPAACTASSSNFVSRSISSYSNGVFTGTITTNECPTLVSTFANAAPTCVTQTFPAVTGSFPQGAPLLGAVGVSLGGMLIYGPYDCLVHRLVHVTPL